MNNSDYTFQPTAATENGGDNAGEEEGEDDREFWNLMKDPAVSEAKMNRAIKRMVAARDPKIPSLFHLGG